MINEPRCRVFAVTALVLAATLGSAGSARAGAIGLVDTTGFHAGIDPRSTDRSTGVWLDQCGGVELLIGSRESRIAGRVRVMVNGVWPAPASSSLFGVALFGLEVQLLRDLTRPWGLHLHADLGPGFLALQHEEFGMADLGMGLHRDLSAHASLFVEIGGQIRFRGDVWGGAVLSAGMRFPID